MMVTNDPFKGVRPFRKQIVLVQPFRHLFDDERTLIAVDESGMALNLSAQMAGCDQEQSAVHATTYRPVPTRRFHTLYCDKVL
jgi:hypothetical protein